MSSVIRQETAVFLFFTLHGALLTMSYDVLRALRRSARHSLLLLSLEDFLFWMAAGFQTFYLAFRESDGAIRGYAVVGMLLGSVLYHVTLSPVIVKLLSALFRCFAGAWRMMKRPCRVLRKLVQKNCKNCKKRIENARKKVYNDKDKYAS